MKDSLNSIVLYNFQKFHTDDFISSHNNPFLSPTLILLLPPSLPPLVTTSLFSISVSWLLFCFIH